MNLRLYLLVPLIILSCKSGVKRDHANSEITSINNECIKYFNFDQDTFRLPEPITGEIFVRDYNIIKIAKSFGSSGKGYYFNFFKNSGDKYLNEYDNSILIRRYDEKNYETYNDENWSLIKDALNISKDTVTFSFILPDTFPSEIEHLEMKIEVWYHINPQYDTGLIETKDFYLQTK